MAKLLGFQKTSSSSTDKVVDLLKRSYLNRTKYGEFNTVEEVDGYLKVLSTLPQNVNVQTEIADMQNKKLQLGAKLNDILTEKNVFDTDLQEALNGAAKNNFNNLKSMIGAYAAIYGDASERYDSDVVSKISERYGTTSEVPEETLSYRKKLQEKAAFYSSLFNAYNVQDPDTGEVGMLNPDNFAVVVDTNPTNGSIQHIEIMPSGEVKDGYMRTEVGVNVMSKIPNKKLPVYLRTNELGITKDGKSIQGAQLGGITYKATKSKSAEGEEAVGILTATKQSPGIWNNLAFWNTSKEEQINGSIDQIRKNGINFDSGAYQYDSLNVPNEAVLRLGNRLFYSTGKQDEVLEMKGKTAQEREDNLNTYLKNIGKDPTKMLPYFITKDSLYSSDGSYKVKDEVDSNYFNVTSTTSPVENFSVIPQKTTPSIGEPQQGFFSNQQSIPFQTNRQNKPEEPSITSEKKTSINDLVEKGKSFFRNKA